MRDFNPTPSHALETALAGFRIKGAKVVCESIGPMLKLYDVQVPDGVKLKTIQNIAGDIARQIKVHSCSIAQTSVLGVIRFEVARADPQRVMLRDVMCEVARHRNMVLPIAMGVSVSGRPIIVDLDRAPHMLIAGTTGSGKSVLTNAIIMSLIGRMGPDKLRLLMIDPKMLELTPYNGIPHLLAPVLTKPGDALRALDTLVSEMEDRYDTMAEYNVRSVTEFNLIPGKYMPRIVAVIDEYADLMLTRRDDIEHCVLRLAQKARAAGIHLILSTQRPSVDVVTGVIKANFPMRVCLRVASRVDSRVVLDQAGAESLLGRGDLLFTGPGLFEAERAHAPFVDLDTIRLVVSQFKGVKE